MTGATPNRSRTPLDSVSFDISWPRDRSFHMIGQGMDAVDWVCLLPEYPAHSSRIECDNVMKMGGGPVATATALCGRYGLKARFIGSVGGDELGRFSLEDLGKEPMDLSCVRIVPNATTQLGIILVDRLTGERTVLWHRDHRLRYAEGELKREWIVSGRLLHLDGCDPDANLQAARWAHEAGMKVSLDVDDVQPGIREVVELTDFLIPSEAFVRNFTGYEDWRQGLRELARRSRGFVAVTRGRKGTAAIWNGRIFQLPAFPVRPIDTNGAGDVFHGAFIYSLFQDWSVQRCLLFAGAAASLSCTRVGARAGIPPLDEVLSLLKAHARGS